MIELILFLMHVYSPITIMIMISVNWLVGEGGLQLNFQDRQVYLLSGLEWNKMFDDTNLVELIIFTESTNFPKAININIPY